MKNNAEQLDNVTDYRNWTHVSLELVVVIESTAGLKAI